MDMKIEASSVLSWIVLRQPWGIQIQGRGSSSIDFRFLVGDIWAYSSSGIWGSSSMSGSDVRVLGIDSTCTPSVYPPRPTATLYSPCIKGQ